MERKIRFIVVFAILTVFGVSKSSAQFFIDENFGFFAGLTISNFTGDHTVGERDARTGFNVGGYYKHPLNKRESLFIMPELMAVSKGGIFYTSQYGFAEFMLRYLELPLFFVMENPRRMSFHIGPYLSMLVNASAYHYRFGEISAADFTTFDFGGTVGFRARVDRYFLGLDISGGMVKIGKIKYHNGEEYEPIGASRNLALMFYAGVFF